MTTTLETGPGSRRTFLRYGGAAAATAVVAAPAAEAADETIPATRVNGIHNYLEFAGATDEDKLRAAIDYFVAARQEVTLTISKSFKITRTLVIDSSYISLEFTCGPLNATAITSGPALTVIGSATSGYPNNRAAITGLRLLGPGASATASTGILFNTDSTTAATTRGLGLWGLEISGFGTGVSFENDAFLISFYNFHIFRCRTAVSMPAGRVNYGENIKFIGGGIGTSTLGVYNANPNGELHFVSTSIDFCVQAVKVDAGRVILHQPHIEINESGANSTLSQFVTGSNSAAQISISGGHLFFHQVPVANYLFETTAGGWGGGIQVHQLSMFNTQMKSGYLAGGTAKVRISQHVTSDGNGSGSGQGSILHSKAANKLVDGNFSLAAPVDAFLNGADATSRTTSPSMTLTTSGNQLLMTRVAGGPGPSVSIDVPVTAGLLYGVDFTIAGSTSTGTMYVSESFVAVTGESSSGIPIVARSSARPVSNLDLAGANAQAPFRKTYPQTTWNRVAPAWATHFRLRFTFGSVTAGVTRFSEIVITEL
ncbi:hypothetical protein C5C41_08650 [Rathayibacter sp. AY1E9]|uniref:twin-arginine translocation signal domain-containing protein n=1 Tax=Rathayibacter sp. AY1E9 TaxID=2080556 RepID=UPI000CE72B5C|nr:twin-arginine translocation signal domain-containing protein [Rathayibacter sp. AY1E9]PPG52785.1 hypothetical protein C5C41_08650 [Rathayibacter sp. AY1E9]